MILNTRSIYHNRLGTRLNHDMDITRLEVSLQQTTKWDMNGVIGGLIPVVKSSLYLTEKKTSWVSRKPRVHPPQGRQ